MKKRTKLILLSLTIVAASIFLAAWYFISTDPPIITGNVTRNIEYKPGLRLDLYHPTNKSTIRCSDLNDYVCKYSRGGPASNLFNEYFAASLLKIWGLSVPDFCFVNIQPEHVPGEILGTTIQSHFFSRPCFGSKLIEFGKEIDPSIQVIHGDKKIVRKIVQRSGLLLISLFDLWLANEDRNHNNYNLLLNTEGDFRFVPIDHEKCFNTNSLSPNRDLVLLTEDETLINTDLARVVYSSDALTANEIDQVIDNYYLCASSAKMLLRTS